MMELVAPAGNLEKLHYAWEYGADSAYIGLKNFSLRVKADNFFTDEYKTISALKEHYAKQGKPKKLLCALNISFHNDDLKAFLAEADYFKLYPIDAFIIQDIGMVSVLRKHFPDTPLHLSTQANCINYEAVRIYRDLGFKRVVLGREASLADIAEIKAHVPEMELECFVHGAMCISYSGRCLLSSFMAGRDANHGECTHPCRWQYSVTEEKRPGESMPVFENERGTFLFNSKDLCMIDHIPELIESGIDSFKIEGRMKTALYAAVTARAYRRAIDDYLESPEKYAANLESYREEIGKCTYREYTTGFFFGKPNEEAQIYDSNTYVRNYTYLGKIAAVDAEGFARFEQKNKFSVGDRVERMCFDGSNELLTVLEIRNHEGLSVESAPHPKEALAVRFSAVPVVGELLRTETAK